MLTIRSSSPFSSVIRTAAVLAAWLALAGDARAQLKPKPIRKGHKLSIKIDSQPQGAAIYVDDRAYGIEAYTPSTIKLPKGVYKIILELQGWKPVERDLQIDRSQVFVFTLEKQAQPAVFDVRAASDQSALGATISVDGAPVGTVPNRIQVAAGSHLVEIAKPGFVPYRDTIVVAESENRTVVVPLVAAAKPGSLLVTADAPGADVFVDGTRRDSVPAVVEGLAEGTHMVEVRKEGLNPWKQPVQIIGGQQVKITAQLQPTAPTVGSLKVLSGTPGATVLVDGDDKGGVNTEIGNVRPGSHIVEVRAPGFDPKRVEVQVVQNELRVVQVDLTASAAVRQVGGVRVISQVRDAEVFIDGASSGKAPVERADLVAGKHFIVVHREGYADSQQEIDIQPGKTIEVVANLHASGSIRALANVAGADVFVDGTPVGKTPATIDNIAVGAHVVEFKSPGYIDARLNVTIAGGQQQIAQADLVLIQTGPTAADLLRNQIGQSSFGAAVIDRFKFNADVGFGYPYFLFARVISGVFKMGTLGGDLGVTLQTNFYETDIGLRPRVQLFRNDPIAVGADMAILGGGGPTKRNSFHFELGAIFTLLAGNYIRVTARPYILFTSDRLCPGVSDIKDDDVQTGGMAQPGSGSLYGDEANVCKIYDAKRDDANPSGYQLPKKIINGTSPFGQPDPRDRFNTTRLMLQGVIEVAASANTSFWVLVEGAPFQDQRYAYTSQFYKGFAPFPHTDFPFYVRFGVTLKY